MNIVQASFQASFDARVERRGELQLAELRAMFRFFDTDGDGAVAAAQACRMFALLGLDVNVQQVQELGEVYLAEFVKIVDSHSPLLPTPTEPAVEAIDSKPEGGEPSVAAGEADQAAHNDGEDPEAVLERSRALWEHEWKLLDTHRRGRVSLQELTRFLATCALILPAADLQRFLECYGEADAGENGNEDAEDALLLTKAGFLRFRYDFTAKDLVPADDGLSSSEADEDDDGAAFFDAGEQQPTDRPEDAEAMRQVARPLSAGAGPSGRRSDLDALSARHEHLAVDPSLFQGSEYDSEGDEGESEASARGMGLDLDAGALGPMGAG